MGLTFLLVNLMVTESPTLFSGASSGSSSTSQTSPNPLSVVAWNESYVLNLTEASKPWEFQIGGWNVEVANNPPMYADRLTMATYESWWMFGWGYDYFKWYDPDGVDVSGYYPISNIPYLLVGTLDANNYTSPVTFTPKNSKTQFTVTFAYNTTAYSSFLEAFNSGGLKMIFNVDMDYKRTSFNALTFIAGLFTFSLPGMPVVTNLILWLIIFPPLGYLVFIFVLKVIGAVFGGG